MQKFRADLHIHSRFSRATSKKLTLRTLSAWAKVKGISVLGTGDFTHPQWRAEMHDQLLFEESTGLYMMNQEVSSEEAIPGLIMKSTSPRFMLQGEISSIYKRGGKVRKVHNLVFMPDIETAEKFCHRLEQIGNLHSDGRPILGLDSRDLLEIVLETHENAFLIPAHIWTPWFSLFGSKSGFDDIKDCFGDLTSHIFALETGLSSNQAMNRLWSSLDSFRLLSNSDAHSGENLGREINLFSGKISYQGILKSLKEPQLDCGTSFEGTLEFYPEEGKYHGDGHRNCSVSLSPKETRNLKGICPVCGHALTIGVLYRVMELADRNIPLFPDEKRAKPVVPLGEILSEIIGVGSKSRKVQDAYFSVLERFGSELDIVTDVPIAELRAYNSSLGEAIHRMRQGAVHITSGFDGEYGIVRMFSDEERKDLLMCGTSLKGQKSKSLLLIDSRLMQQEKSQKKSMKKNTYIETFSSEENIEKSEVTRNLDKEHISLPAPESTMEENVEAPSLGEENIAPHLNSEQEQASMAGPGPVLVIAGPGTGKTSTLIGRIAWLIEEGISPRRILAVTFTRKAATEIEQRLANLLPESALPQADTLHALALDLWHKTHADVPVLLSEESAKLVFSEANPDIDAQTIKYAWRSVNIARERLAPVPEEYATFAANYTAHKSAWNLADYTDLLEFWLERTASGLDKRKWDQILVDEIQDLSSLQLALVCSLLPEGGEGFFGIGDPDQSIYGFRGATGKSLDVFKAYWPALEVIALTKNYRSCPEIIQTATALQEGSSSSKGLQSMAQGKGYIHVFHAPTADEEARWISDRVASLLGSSSHTLLDARAGKKDKATFPQGEYAPGDIAILVRTHALGHIIRKYLSRIGLPVSEPQTDAFWEDPRVALVLRSVGRMYGIALAYGGSDQQSFDCPDKILAKGPLGLAAYFSTIPPFEEHFWQTKAFKRLVKTYDSVGGWAELITWINLQNEFELIKTKAQKIQILSIHAAKGLEFPVVFLPCMEDGILPFAGQDLLSGHLEKNQGFDVEEERRLLYVGATRAKEVLFLSYAGKRMLFGKELRLNPSRFLNALPKEIITASALVEKKSISAQQLSLID